MALINWSDQYSLAIPSIDNQHKKLIELINQLHEALAAGKAKEVLGSILVELADYTVTHFKFEEQMMNKHGYTSFNGHVTVHNEFVNKIQGYVNDFEQGRSAFSISLMNFLRDWLTNHILKTDKEYAKWFADRGIRP